MRQHLKKWPGTWSIICDVCGFKFQSDEVLERWDGLIVCHKDWEPKHPQLYVRLSNSSTPPNPVRVEPTDIFTDVTYLDPNTLPR